MITFRNYQKTDYQAVRSLLQSVSMYAKEWEMEDNLGAMIERDEQAIIVAEDTDTHQVVGNVFLIPYGSKVILIFRLAIKPEYQKQGIGSRLIQYITEVAKKKGVTEIGLFVDVSKKELHEFYKKLGFTLFPETIHYMYKELK